MNPIEKAQESLNNMTLEKLAERLGVSKQTVIHYKQNPGNIPLEVLAEISRLTGYSMDYLTNNVQQMNRGPKLKPAYKEAKKVTDKIKSARKLVRDIEDFNSDDNEFLESIKERMVKDVRDVIDLSEYYSRKPRIVALGRSDSGKSTLGNYLLNEEILPAEYAPLTSSITYLHSIDDKPSYLEKLENTVVIGRHKDDKGNIALKALPFDQYKDLDAKYIIRKGHYTEILDAYCTKKGFYNDNSEFVIDSIHVFIDNEFLKEVDYIDVPGFHSGDENDDVAISDDVALTQKMYQADVLFYLCQVDSFFNGSDLSVLSHLMDVRGSAEGTENDYALKTLFILGTHTVSIGNPEKVLNIMHQGIDRLVEQMTDLMLENIGIKNDINGKQKLYDRCFGFDPRVDYYTGPLNKAIADSIYEWTDHKLSAADFSLRRVSSSRKKNSKVILEEAKDNIKASEIDQKKVKEQKEKAITKLSELKKTMNASIRRHKSNCSSEFSSKYDDLIDVDNIEELIDRKNVKNKRDSLNDFAAYLGNELNDVLSKTLKKHSEQFVEEVNESIDQYKSIWSEINLSVDNISMNSFNFQNAFAAGLTGITVYGALALWASVVAGSSNLGAYILISKLVSALSAIGISLGGTAAVTSAVAAIGGPITLGISLAIVAAVAVFGILSGTWKRRAARKIVDAFEKNESRDKCLNKITDYWLETSEALGHCFDSLHNESMKEFELMVNVLEKIDPEKAETFLDELYKKIIEVYEIIEQ